MTAWATDAGVEIESVEPYLPAFDDVFVELVSKLTTAMVPSDEAPRKAARDGDSRCSGSAASIRTLAFFRKDLFEVLRQPRLLLTLVLGPFLILLIFGVGFAPDPPTLRTIVVVPPGSGLESRSEELADALGDRIVLTEMTDDEAAARQRIAAGDADVLVVVPADAAELVRNNQHAPIQIYHNQIDPFESSFIEVFADSAVDEINQAILEEVVVAGQAETAGHGRVPPRRPGCRRRHVGRRRARRGDLSDRSPRPGTESSRPGHSGGLSQRDLERRREIAGNPGSASWRRSPGPRTARPASGRQGAPAETDGDCWPVCDRTLT